jgi:hypothetical protein
MRWTGGGWTLPARVVGRSRRRKSMCLDGSSITRAGSSGEETRRSHGFCVSRVLAAGGFEEVLCGARYGRWEAWWWPLSCEQRWIDVTFSTTCSLPTFPRRPNIKSPKNTRFHAPIGAGLRVPRGGALLALPASSRELPDPAVPRSSLGLRLGSEGGDLVAMFAPCK